MEECNRCLQYDNCTPFAKQLCVYYEHCSEFINVENSCYEGSTGGEWIELSYNKYIEGGLDYGDPTDWDLFMGNNGGKINRYY